MLALKLSLRLLVFSTTSWNPPPVSDLGENMPPPPGFGFEFEFEFEFECQELAAGERMAVSLLLQVPLISFRRNSAIALSLPTATIAPLATPSSNVVPPFTVLQKVLCFLKITVADTSTQFSNIKNLLFIIVDVLRNLIIQECIS